MDTLSNKGKFIFNTFWCKLFFVIFPFFSEIPIFMPYLVPLMKLGIIWACLCILYDFFTKRKLLKTRYIGLIILFLISFAITVISNFDTMLKMNVIEFCYTVTVLTVLFPANDDNEKNIKELTVVNYILVTLTLIVTLISLIMFVIQYKYAFTYNDYTYVMGYDKGRLVGLYKNAIYPTGAYGIWCAVAQLFINSKRNMNRGRRVASKIYLIFSLIASWCFVVLQNSKGLFIGCAVALAFVICFKVNSFDTEKFFKNKCYLKIISTIAATAVCLGVLFGSIPLVRSIASYSVIKTAQSTGKIDELENVVVEDNKESISFDREISSDYGFATGRIYVWEQGIKHFLVKPLFGYGPYSFSGKIEVTHTGTEKVSHFHNVFMHALVSCGAIGFILFFSLCFCAAVQLLKFLFNSKNKNYVQVVGTVGIIIFLFVINMADTTILFQTKHSGFIFFIYLGYLIAMTSDEKVYFFDKPVRAFNGFLEERFFKDHR